MNDRDWYELTEGGSLLQGDILMNCPVFSVTDPLQWPLSADAEVDVEAKVFDLVVILLVDGNVPGLSLLHKRESNPVLPWSVVDFHRPFTLPKSFLTQFAAEAGERLRIRSPYREHLAQAFA